MVHVHVAADTYGRVKTVRRTSIVTRFWGVQLFPCFPTTSYYVSADSTDHENGVPLVAISCARLDSTSVTMSYARGLFAGLFLVGCLAMVPLYTILLGNGAGIDELGWLFTKCLIGAFLIGAIGGILTYFVPLTSRRERQIREHCAQILGPAIDPARLPPADASEFLESLNVELLDDQGEAESNAPEFQLRQELVRTRCRIACGEDVASAEQSTDQLLNRLASFNRTTSPGSATLC